jgi:hypothetical protein
MKKKLSIVAVLIVLVAGVVFYFRLRPAPEGPALDTLEASRLLINRNWLDVMPKTPDDRLHVYRFTPSMGGGVFQDRTVFAGNFELFTFKLDHDNIEFTLPHKHQRVVSSFAVRRVQDHAPFDLELTIDSDPRGPHRYYGFSNERAEETDLETLINSRSPGTATAPPAPATSSTPR